MNIPEKIEIEIDFSDLEEVYKSNTQEFIKILKKTQVEYAKYLLLMEAQIRTGNLEEFRNTRHKISATLLLFKLKSFHEYLLFIKEYFSNGIQDNEKEEAIANLRLCFDKIQDSLSRKVTQIN